MFKFSAYAFLLFLVLIAGTVACTAGNASGFAVPGPTVDAAKAPKSGEQTAVVAGGCFWGIQAVFQHVKGVKNATSGYSGGDAKTAQYEIVSTGETGHAESVKITYDPAQVTYGELLRVFFSVAHDPTQLNRQGPDWGKQYRSAIFFHTPEQEAAAKASKEQMEKSHRFSKPIVTQIVPAVAFFEAEDYHQQYLEKKGLASCHIKA
jgi:peptide-methionine (S)-S-oxide reductase